MLSLSRSLAVVVAIGMSSCSPEGDASGSANKCATDLFPSYNPNVLQQCVAACIKCEHGTHDYLLDIVHLERCALSSMTTRRPMRFIGPSRACFSP